MSRSITETTVYKKLLEQETSTYGISPLSATIAQHLQKITEILLGEVGAYMPEYTLHNIDHVVNVLDIINDVIPSGVNLNRSELTILIYAVALHDIGMLISRDDAEQLKKTEAYRHLLAEFDKDTPEPEILSEYIRRTHVERSCDYVDKFKKDLHVYHLDFEIDGIDFRKYLKSIILSHGLPVSKLTDGNYPTNALIGKERVNVKYLALLLRLGDILDFDRSRTPLFLQEHRKVRNSKSVSEWEKHLSINGFSITSTQIEYQAECHSAEIHRCVVDFLSYIEYERKETMDCIRKMNTPDRSLELNDPVIFQVDTDGSYIYEDLDITFDYKKVLSILMGTELYSSAEVFLRELLQNSYDACFVRKELSEKLGDGNYQPEITIHFDSKTKILSVEDNGIGMDMSSIKNYVTKIGSSYYKSKEFQSELIDYAPISNFGIGILSCFMVSNSLNIESLRYSTALTAKEPINITLNLDNSFVERRPSLKNTSGTRISLYIHDKFAEELNLKKMKEIIEDNTAFQRIPIKLSVDTDQILLNNQHISVPLINGHPGIETICVDNDVLEGFLIVYGIEHQSLVKNFKICQQGFRINGKVGITFGLKPIFLQFMGFDINIKTKMLSTKASRENIIKDSAYIKLQDMISDLVLEHFRERPNELVRYLERGTQNIISKRKAEYDFLIENLKYFVIDTKNNTVDHNSPLFYDLQKQKEVCKIAFLSPSLYGKNPEKYIADIIPRCDFIIVSALDMHYFIQLAKPYCTQVNEVVSKEPGLIYYLLTYDFSRDINLKDYPNTYSYEDITKNAELIGTNQIFCYITNNQYNFLRLSFNKNHPWGRLFTEQKDNLCVKKATIVLKENVSSCILDNPQLPLRKLTEYSGEYTRMIHNTCDQSFKTVNIFSAEILADINSFLGKTIDKKLLDEYGLSDRPLTHEDFVSWWFI